ncbi:GNAT family N-acetyltransferase [Nonomuraea soli]|uniref:Ribosomal-protein-alanine N-acetyltransferase n=1 Tax=Nonomuraea soli TaxID=1032476 RepID=A0A7W0HMD9_9ACTN|nr:GNAT family protein [Nonomuraea soli]MBA2888699.1 ribosomal-protein-alanine N-acetyltransferase [Nonomuraea soli]
MSYVRQGKRVAIRPIDRGDCAELVVLNRESADLHARWMPGPPIVDREAFDAYLRRFEEGPHVGLLVCDSRTGRIVGRVNVNDIVRGSKQTATLGYAAYVSTTGRGYMTEGLGLVVEHAFGELGLHRLEANIQPGNTRSVNLVRRVGFRKEGYSPDFQFVDGAWRDHERWAITVEMVQSPAATRSPAQPR